MYMYIYTLIATNYVINSQFVISGLIVSTQLLLTISFVNATTSTRESITRRCKVTLNLYRSDRIKTQLIRSSFTV